MDALFATVLWLIFIGNMVLACSLLSRYPDDPQSMSIAQSCGCDWAAHKVGTGDTGGGGIVA